jgi:putative ATP-dependent endonuclease of OLD family
LSDEADKLFQSLKLFVGESSGDYEGGIHELSLGGANLIFLTLKLLEFKYQKAQESLANFLLIEEPEAHIHTHIQKTLFDRIAYADTQVIYSTHSTQISEVSNVSNLNILGRVGAECEAYQPTNGLSADEVGAVQRYLDAVRSNLLFAKSVVLVEGDAEEILIPALFRVVYGISLDELGVSLVNIRSTGFKNVAVLFHDGRIRKRCSIVSDLDRSIVDTTPDPNGPDAYEKFKAKCRASEASGLARKIALEQFIAGNPWVSAHLADHTFEVDFVAAGNAGAVVKLVPLIYVDQATRNLAEVELLSGDKAQFGRRVLTMATSAGKGWFAILLAKYVDHKSAIPGYIAKAIFTARPSLTPEIIFNIYRYRIECAHASAQIPQSVFDVALGRLNEYRRGEIDLGSLKFAMSHAIIGDQVHAALADVA